ncbi:hypothetical protein Cpap_0313 [Ruminiclostridium papyrosolvens DSM 2782]|uniref:Uncharacterized protein n=1 Tax=Ruminiclostridium papyrosolvens DSM 2782 TaxID=588581 RepID=F1TGP3_9FIRM|nr:hypothetical protein [Ruminiclostridium papyrosolvens]EGD46374.1 hypothetical protein Cpap_0313 [Ruminiclostridium papyrosolvens DSM 2782]WES34013.1 hypothetical protein P0092_19985 [Ruminiclostridium papyrosolvens DSM 2782]
MKECPNCKVIRENNNRYCECGYDLRLNTIDEDKVKYLKFSRNYLKTILINLSFSVLGLCLTPYVLIGFFGVLNGPTTGSIAVASGVTVLFFVALVISNYVTIKKVSGKSKIYIVLIGLATFLLGVALLFCICFSIILGIF